MLRERGDGLSSAVESGDRKIDSVESMQIVCIDAEIMEKTHIVLSHALNIGQDKNVFRRHASGFLIGNQDGRW
jgi:hypothetical protein